MGLDRASIRCSWTGACVRECERESGVNVIFSSHYPISRNLIHTLPLFSSIPLSLSSPSSLSHFFPLSLSLLSLSLLPPLSLTFSLYPSPSSLSHFFPLSHPLSLSSPSSHIVSLCPRSPSVRQWSIFLPIDIKPTWALPTSGGL